MRNINSKEYSELINSDKLTVIKYFATWCGPCRMLTPIIEGMVPNYPDVNFAELDIDQEREIAVNEGIRGVPTIIFYKNGKVLDRVSGVYPAQAYTQKIESLS